MEGNHRVKVGLRVKPPGEVGPTAAVLDGIFSSHTNGEIYQAMVSPILAQMEFSTIFTYGRTGSGKTYTMFGDDSDPGMAERLLCDLVQRHQVVYLRCVEIYNEVLTDLLSGKEVRLVQEQHRVRMVNEEQRAVANRSEIKALLQLIKQQRKTSETEHNLASSRSHTVIEVSAVGVAVNLVDLAGNEKIGDDLDRRKEGLLINKSLLTLGKVIDQLHTDTQHVSYRESKLTRLLQSTLSGGAILCICTVLTLADTQTVKFAERLKRIKGAVAPPEKSKDEIIADLQLQVRALTAQLGAAQLSALPPPPKDSPLVLSTKLPAECPGPDHASPLPEPPRHHPEVTEPASSPAEPAAGATADHIVEALHLDSYTPQSQVNLYEMIYCYFRSEVTQELANTLTPDEIDQVHLTFTKKKRDHRRRNQLRTILRETRTEIRPYEEEDDR